MPVCEIKLNTMTDILKWLRPGDDEDSTFLRQAAEAHIREIQVAQGSEVMRVVSTWIDWVAESQGVTLEDAREIVLKKIESKDGRVRKASVISFQDGKFLTTSLFPVTAQTPELQITGVPHVKSDKNSVRVGCVRFTNEALFEIIIMMSKQLKSDEPIVFQVGDYESPE